MQGAAGRREVADRRQPQAAAARELDELCGRRRARSCARRPDRRAGCRAGPRQRLRRSRGAVVHQHHRRQADAAVARVGGDGVAGGHTLGFPHGQRAFRDEEARQREALVVSAARRAPDVDHEFRGAVLRDVGNLELPPDPRSAGRSRARARSRRRAPQSVRSLQRASAPRASAPRRAGRRRCPGRS